MTSLRDLYGKRADDGHDDGGNHGVDFVILYKLPPEPSDMPEAEAGFVRLIEALTKAGMAAEVRQGQDCSILVLVRIASPLLLARRVYQARLQDWLHGVRASAPGPDLDASLRQEPVTEAERLRLVHHLITRPRNEGGAGAGAWQHVAAIFPLHDPVFNKSWIQKWSSKYRLDQADIDEMRDRFGEEVALYFAFVRFYLNFLLFPALLGLVSWLLLGHFSSLYALGCALWSVVFVEHWRRQEADLALRWAVRHVSSLEQPRPEFRWEYEAADPVTGELVKVYPYLKRLRTQLLQLPFTLACVLVLGGLVVVCNSLEIFINEMYDGPAKPYLTFLPTVLLSVFTPTLSSVLMRAAKALTERENYKTMDSYKAALIQKQFVLNFMTSYMALLFTALFYIPFGHVLVPCLDFWKRTAQVVSFSAKAVPTHQFRIRPERISNQMFYFTVTAQVVNFATEIVVPHLKNKLFAKARQLQAHGKADLGDCPHEAAFLARVRDECGLDVYDVTADYREMVMQYGYLTLFSVAWPLAACCFLVNNWVELRSDALKIALSCKRPMPWRCDSIGPWLTALGFLSWLGSLTSAAIVFLCRDSWLGLGSATAMSPAKAWTGLLGVVLAEHLYLVAQLAVRLVMGKLESPGRQQERKERYLMKRRLLAETLGPDHGDDGTAEALLLGQETLTTAGEGGPETDSGDRFWRRNPDMGETILMGRRIIDRLKDESRQRRKLFSSTSSSPHPPTFPGSIKAKPSERAS